MPVLIMLTTVQISVAEFVEVQSLTGSELRERFDLPATCEPTLGAARSLLDDVMVLISCEDRADGDVDASS